MCYNSLCILPRSLAQRHLLWADDALVLCRYASLMLDEIISYAGSMRWSTYLWFLIWMVICAAVYSLYSIHNVEVPYAAVDSPVQRCRLIS